MMMKTDDLKHELTTLGRMEVRDLIEAKSHPECYKEIVKAAMNKVKEYSDT